MAITRIGASAGDGTTITIPASHQAGDAILIYAFRGATTAPTLPSGWTQIATGSSGASSVRIGWKLAISAADTSGTWTNATGLICHVYRGVSTKQLPIQGAGSASTGTGTSVTYAALTLKNPNTSWVVGFSATKTTDSTLETAPTNLSNRSTAVGAATEYAGHDSNGIYASSGTWPSTAVSVGGTSAEWRSLVVEILAEQGLPMNFQFAASAGLAVAR